MYSSSTNKNFKIWGDKTPQNTYFIKHIFPVYPSAKYVFIVRDGRDVVNSLVKMMQLRNINLIVNISYYKEQQNCGIKVSMYMIGYKERS